METSPHYVRPDPTLPLDLAAHVALAPAAGKVKGMFFRRVIEEAWRKSGTSIRERSYFPFSDYPLADWLTLLHDAALAAYPHQPVREGLSLLGRSMYPTFADSMIGKVIVAMGGGDVMRALPLYPKIWSVISNHGTAAVDELTPGRVVIRQRNVWDFVDCFQVGSLEGGMRFFGVTADVKVASLSPCDADFEVTWDV